MRSRSLSRSHLTPATRAALEAAHIDGARVRLAEQLPVDDYADVAKVLAALGGLWSPAARATVFPDGTDAALLVKQVLAGGVVPLHPRTAEGWVRTPDDVADDLCSYPHSDLAWLPPGSRVLEPSAGVGSLAAAMLRINPGVAVTAVESNPARAAVCENLDPAITVHTQTFETYAARAMAERVRFDAIVMNPPFSVPSDKALWIEHLRLAWHLLAPGARLVCVVPASIATRGDTRHRDIRTLVEYYGTHEAMPFEAYKPSGTSFSTSVVRMTKPVRSGATPEFLFRPVRLAAPVRVDEPRFTGEAARTTPVQVWHDSWRRRDRVLRYHGRCAVCGWLLWGADDGENDPRGVLGDFTAGFSLVADDYDQHGPTVGLCCGCGNDGDRYEVGVGIARTHWSAPVLVPALAAAA
ncbi:methyltransferase [Actinoplanes regularis]|uniref:Methyltransferase small domain-containing protein n=1 Tax=Actinoplanes regularis TaxID=52697 RepID=A0A238XKG1_9ACTN|nr:class I SAM-dependent methyltransferase [Actinoplanes regularis]GIE90504.1 hypothetical protein Are01nite_69840 [Actinoplanes regularis]SNR58824.1 Methyltransferase small domain-containing protein [Actinoplanes regularis]